ncbi:MAG TPA: hypothetical protein HA312_04320 [Candidatus Poseidonia sp.]|nr:hypothetical protein [Poseidonia sp.]
MYTKRLFFLNLSVETPSNGAPARLRMDGRSDGPMKAYRVSGTAPFGSQRQPFSYDLPAADADAATHKVYSLLGSRHRVTRRSINIESVGEIDPRTSTEPTVLHHFRDEIAAKGGLIAQAKEEE